MSSVHADPITNPPASVGVAIQRMARSGDGSEPFFVLFCKFGANNLFTCRLVELSYINSIIVSYVRQLFFHVFLLQTAQANSRTAGSNMDTPSELLAINPKSNGRRRNMYRVYIVYHRYIELSADHARKVRGASTGHPELDQS